jgi:aquaporin Z
VNYRAYIAEAIGTFWLTFGGCGSAVIAAGFPQVGIGLLGVALAFGLTVVTMAYAIGHISGCHLNPAVTVGLTAGGRFPVGQVIPYIIAQLVGAIVAALLLYAIAKGAPGFDLGKGFATNGPARQGPFFYLILFLAITGGTSEKRDFVRFRLSRVLANPFLKARALTGSMIFGRRFFTGWAQWQVVLKSGGYSK